MKEEFVFTYGADGYCLETRGGEYVACIPWSRHDLNGIDKLKILELLEAVHERAFSLGQQDARRKAAQESVPTWGNK